MSGADANDLEALRESVEGLAKRVRRLTVAVVMMVLALFLLAAVIFGDMITYYALDPAIFGGATIGAAVLGFFFGLFARLKA
jgi:membrane protein YdbS with pleckstrin-like domain